MVEQVDVVVVGARCSGTAIATTLARQGVRVVALDRASFPSDTLSTHLLWPAGLAEIQALGALERVRAIGAPEMRLASAASEDHDVASHFNPVDGIDFAMCVRRIGLDAALVETARVAGAEVRERSKVTELVREDGRVVGVRYAEQGGSEREIRARLVVGADGRRSSVARMLGVDEPVVSSASGRACYFAYWRDAPGADRDTAAQWRFAAELGTAFPCDDGQVLVLLQPPTSRIEEFRADLRGTYERSVAAIPGLAARLQGAEQVSQVRQASDIESYFRRSSGPGWALVGDAGHFKDPVTAQGIRDALRFGRLLGESVGPLLGDPARLDRALREWERRRERECRATYHWTNVLARGEAMTHVEREMYRACASAPHLLTEVLDVFSRIRRPRAVFSVRRALVYAARAVLRRPGSTVEVAREIASMLPATVRDRAVEAWVESQVA